MSYHCRLIRDEEFDDQLENYLIETFFRSEPMNEHLNIRIPDEIDRPWFEQVFSQAKADHLSLAFYDPHKEDCLPIAYAINHHERQSNAEDLLYSKLNETCLQKHDHISQLMSKLHENLDLFEQFQCEKIFHVYLLGVDPRYRRHQLASELIRRSIDLAREKNFDLVYADVTSNYSCNAFLKHQFEIVKTIDYRSYENSFGEKIFAEMKIHSACSILVKDLRKK